MYSRPQNCSTTERGAVGRWWDSRLVDQNVAHVLSGSVGCGARTVVNGGSKLLIFAALSPRPV
jgi:hypothetical protein